MIGTQQISVFRINACVKNTFMLLNKCFRSVESCLTSAGVFSAIRVMVVRENFLVLEESHFISHANI